MVCLGGGFAPHVALSCGVPPQRVIQARARERERVSGLDDSDSPAILPVGIPEGAPRDSGSMTLDQMTLAGPRARGQGRGRWGHGWGGRCRPSHCPLPRGRRRPRRPPPRPPDPSPNDSPNGSPNGSPNDSPNDSDARPARRAALPLARRRRRRELRQAALGARRPALGRAHRLASGPRTNWCRRRLERERGHGAGGGGGGLRGSLAAGVGEGQEAAGVGRGAGFSLSSSFLRLLRGPLLPHLTSPHLTFRTLFSCSRTTLLGPPLFSTTGSIAAKKNRALTCRVAMPYWGPPSASRPPSGP